MESSPIPNPFVHQEKPHEPLIDAVFCAYLREMAKEHDLECERIGGKLTEGVDEVVVRLIYFHPAKIDKARELQVVATEKLLAAINNNEQLRPYIKNYPLSLDKLRVDILLENLIIFLILMGSWIPSLGKGTRCPMCLTIDTMEKSDAK